MKLTVKSPFWRQVLIELGAREVPPQYPNVPGSRWRDADGDIWILADDGRMYAAGCTLGPNDVAESYGPLTRAGGE